MRFFRRQLRLACVMVVGALVACTGDDPQLAAESSSGTSSSSSGAASSTSGAPVDAGPACQAGAKECVGSVPRTCDSNGAWHDEAACSGAAPICAGGACVSFRLHGGIGTMGVSPTAPGSLRLRDNGLERGTRTCGGSLCVTGGITP
jgi:hypothetical protein